MIFTINGLDVTPYIQEDGIKWTLNGVDGPNAGRTMDARMYRGLVAYKAKCELSCLWMPKNKAYQLFQRIMPEFFTVITDTVPWVSGTATMTMYSNNESVTLSGEYSDGTKTYTDLSFPLIER